MERPGWIPEGIDMGPVEGRACVRRPVGWLSQRATGSDLTHKIILAGAVADRLGAIGADPAPPFAGVDLVTLGPTLGRTITGGRRFVTRTSDIPRADGERHA
jgi:hypothetical protein